MLGCGRFRNLLTKSFVFETVSGVTSGHRQNFLRSCFFQRSCWVLAGADKISGDGELMFSTRRLFSGSWNHAGLKTESRTKIKNNVLSAFEHSVKKTAA